MSEQTSEPVEGAQTTEQQQGDPADKPLGPGGEKALKAEREARAAAEKAASELKARLDEIERANLSELEKAQRDAQDAKDAAAKANVEALRYRLAAKHGITDEDAVLFLTGPDEEAMTAQAERLAARLSLGPTNLAPDPNAGGSGQSAPVDQLTRSELKSMTPEQIAAARKDGRLNDLLGIT